MNTHSINMSKGKKRDVLSGLMIGSPPEGIISKKELNALNEFLGNAQQINSTHNRQPEKTER